MAYAAVRFSLGDACDAWAGLEIESDRWNLLCKFTTVARDDSRNCEMFYVFLSSSYVHRKQKSPGLMIGDPELSSKIRSQRLS